jgi:thiol-disulfide isomerase/thioredoxin
MQTPLHANLNSAFFASIDTLHASSTHHDFARSDWPRAISYREIEQGLPMNLTPRNTLLPALLLALLAAAPLHQATAQTGFHVNKDLYSETSNASADISAALVRARREHKHVLLDFGGNWCGDCQVLDIYYHQSPNAEILAKNYILVHINIGHMDKNVDVAKKYNVPITRGVPALAIIDAHGELLYSEREKEFEHATPEAITAFLNRWKPSDKPASIKKA